MRRQAAHQNGDVTDTNLVGYRHAEGDPANDTEARCVHDRVGDTYLVPKEPLS